MVEVLTGLRFIGIGCAAYLAWRAMLVLFRIRWARHAYPSLEVDTAPAVSDWEDRCRGCLVGLAVGDSLHLPAESLPRWLTRLRYPGPPKMRRGIFRMARRVGDISDDTQLTICVARSIDQHGRYLHERFVAELGRWSYFRLGAGRASSDAAIGARRAKRRPSARSEGNGAAIRVAPLAIAIENTDELLSAARENAGATHSSEASTSATIFVALLLRECLARPPSFLDTPTELLSAIREAAQASGFAIDEGSLDVERAKASGHVRESIPAVLSILLKKGNDFEASMASVSQIAGDTDSIAALVGACIGAQIGWQALPARWRGVVQHRGYLLWLARRLANPSPAPRNCLAEIEVVEGDVSRREVDVIVNAWNRNLIPLWLLVPQGVSKAIRAAGGAASIRAISRSAPLPLGGAMETHADGLAATWVIHADAINLAWRASDRSIRLAARQSLQLAQWLGARTVALPCLGAGSGGHSPETAMKIIQEVAEDHRHCFDRIEVVRI